MTTAESRNRARDDPDERASEAAEDVAYVVDDDPAALALMCEVAEDAGWAARGFTRIGDLRARMKAERPRMLILDDDLPDGSGGDLARELRDDPSMEDVSVVVCTAAQPMRRAEINTWAPVVAKPFRIEELEHFLDTARRNRSAGRAAG